MSESSIDSQDPRFPRKRGVGFPVVGLPEAVIILRKAGQGGNEQSNAAFARYLGHSTPDSGSFKRRKAAFRDWKFITGRGDRVYLTELGQRVAYPTEPGQERQDLQEAFRNCDLFFRVYHEAAKGEPYTLTTLGNLGVRYGVAPVSKERFANSLSESAVAAGFAEMQNGAVMFLSPDSRELPLLPAVELPKGELSAVANRIPEVVVGTTSAGVPAENRHSAPPQHRPEEVAADRPAMLHQQSWEIGGGSLILEIRSNRTLPAKAFMQIGRVMSEIETLKALLAEGSDSSGDTDSVTEPDSSDGRE